MTPDAALARGLEQLGLRVGKDTREVLMGFVSVLMKWNTTHNLTAIRDPLTIVSHHLLDSLAALPHLGPGALADVGSGGGLPGIPVAICEPNRRVVLNDSNQKKTAFLRQAIIELELSNAEVHVGRAEEWHPAERFPVVISRGFAALKDFCASARHLVAPHGALVAMKGDISAAELLDGGDCVWEAPIPLDVPFLDARRCLVVSRGAG
jgi:16S rRNA (guanine527-N7)-methyltransferase